MKSKIQLEHLKRKAFIYLRQSTPKQVRENQESVKNQQNMKERLNELGWKKSDIEIISTDLGRSGVEATTRPGFQYLVTQISLGYVGVVMGFDVSRIARSCKDWYHLIELCSIFNTLIADGDGIYQPKDYNDRLLLGLKGTISEAELHSLRARMDAGRLSKAQRGELIQNLPTGLIRSEYEGVVFDHDKEVQSALRLVFKKFSEFGSIRKVMNYFNQHDIKLPRRQVSGIYSSELIWKSASSAALASILHNPAYAGAFAYGRRCYCPERRIPGHPSAGRIRCKQGQWISLVKGIYPNYISWKCYEDNQKKIAMNKQAYDEHLRQRGVARNGQALLQGIVVCRRCGHRMNVRYRERGGFEYVCRYLQSHYGKKTCQFISGKNIDIAITKEFFKVLSHAEINALNEICQKNKEDHEQLFQHLENDFSRCNYQANLARRQYESVDPENRLVAATLERKWEETLVEVNLAKERLELKKLESNSLSDKIPDELIKNFVDIGKNLPEIWPRIKQEDKKKLLRTLINQIHLDKIDGEGEVETRIVWEGNAVTELIVNIPAFCRRGSKNELQAFNYQKAYEKRTC
ncbi:MAG: recombinase family protein [Oligoflexia bacterium]|nr:recombinase family protein [Oligoflexia bacterium]